MADEYIKRSDALTVIERFNGYLDDDMQYRIKFMLNRDCPAADVIPVVRGRWIDDAVCFYRKCSECGCCIEWNKNPFLDGIGEYNFCPNCGAKMDV